MKKKQRIVIIATAVILILSISAFYFITNPKDKCTSKDRQINNCVPAGSCGPTPALDAVIDCDVKNYDKKYNTDL